MDWDGVLCLSHYLGVHLISVFVDDGTEARVFVSCIDHLPRRTVLLLQLVKTLDHSSDVSLRLSLEIVVVGVVHLILELVIRAVVLQRVTQIITILSNKLIVT